MNAPPKPPGLAPGDMPGAIIAAPIPRRRGEKTVATLAGVPLLTDSPVNWSLTPGVSHSTSVLYFHENDLEKMRLELRNDVKLSIDTGDTLLEVEKLTILSLVSGDAPYRRGAVVVDRRWKWPKPHVRRSYNVRRRMAATRLLRADELGNAGPVVNSVWYAPYSLNNGKPWTAQEVLKDIMAELEPTADVTIPPFKQLLPIADLVIDDDGSAAVARALAQIPGVTCTVERDGTVRFYDSIDLRTEEIVVGRAGYAFAPQMGWPRLTESPLARPRAVNVLFQREMEIRFDFRENVDGPAAGGIVGVDNVLPITDPTLVVEGRTLVQGTWITIDQAVAAWTAAGLPLGAPGPLTTRLVRDLWNPVSNQLLLKFMNFGGVPDTIWSARISALTQNYRQTFRLPREVMDRLRDISDTRIAILDPVTGTRAPAQAWTDYCIVPSARARLDRTVAGNLQPGFPVYGVNIIGYATRLDTKRVTPIRVSILNGELGIVRLDYQTDPSGFFSGIFPSAVDNIPTADPSNRTRQPRWWAEAPGPHIQGAPILRDFHGTAIILTCAPGAPNGQEQMSKVTVTPAEAIAALQEAGADHKILPADGPELDIVIGPGVATARYAWLDEEGFTARVRRAIGLDNGDGVADDGAWINQRDCQQIALATAAVAYSETAERLQGQKTVAMNPTLSPRGSVSSVVHSLSPSGEATTSVAVPGAPAQSHSMMAFLPDSVRRIVAKLVSRFAPP